MKKIPLIILGVIILLSVVGVWVYLLVFGTPKESGGVFSNFDFGGSRGESVVTNPTVVDTAPNTSEGKPQALKQLTTRPVAGAAFISGGIRYVERGTGYIYDIMFSNGNESQVSGTTLPHTTDALLSEDGTSVVVRNELEGVGYYKVGTIQTDTEGKGSLITKSLPSGAHEVSFVDQNRIAYLESTPSGSSGVRYDIAAGTTSSLFSVPLRDIRVLWGNEKEEAAYIYTTPTITQSGYLYRIAKSGVEYLSDDASGLMGIRYDGGYIISGSRNSDFFSEAHSGTSTFSLPFYLLPEKCTANPGLEHTLYCGAQIEKLAGSYPDSWYKGASSFSDLLWLVDVHGGKGTLLSNFLDESGREIDVEKIGTNADGTLIYFINKNDGSLWVFDTTI